MLHTSEARFTRSKHTWTRLDGTKVKSVHHEVTVYGFDCGEIKWNSDEPDRFLVRKNVTGWADETRTVIRPEWEEHDSLRAAKKRARALAVCMYSKQAARR